VPVLWRYEVSAVLTRAHLRGHLPRRKVDDSLEDLAALDITVDVAGTSRILTDVHGIAAFHRLTAYDAAYLELALRRNLAIASLDQELLDACKVAGVAVL
jgi:predicted nucleic acid-binding protein